eukprot:TRINITY_DN8512_c0_g1_i1.p1 TRINITY_DN8512_c0_g1~~TRINITY_DN8512_c0_g1_i1.p1  ORF type:complete len:571 (+),score=205.82 TRINITY_DN8512_c0_g1_i1:38-1750(+)
MAHSLRVLLALVLPVASNAAVQSSLNVASARRGVQTAAPLLRGGVSVRGTSLLGEEPNPDEVARDNFVRRCVVTLDVGDPALLPANALKRFCEETDAVVECRLRLVSRLKETHRRGGDLSGFCGAAYDWFQKKYGMFCPDQCHKHQCKATCAWLKRQKKMKAADQDLKAELEASAATRAEMKALASKVKELEAEKLRRARVKDQTEVELNRSIANDDEKKEYLKSAQLKLKRLQTDVKAWEDASKKAAGEIKVLQDQLQANRFALDKAKANKSRESGTAKVAQAKLDRKEQLLARAAADVAEAKGEAENLQTRVGSSEDNIKSMGSQVDELKKALEDAKKATAKAEEANKKNPGKFEALIKDQMVRQKDVQRQYDEAKAARDDVQAEVDRFKKRIEKVKKDIIAAEERQKKLQGEADSANGDIDEIESQDVVKYQNMIKKLTEDRAKLQADLNAKEKVLEKAKKTLFLATSAAQDGAAALGKAVAAAQEAADRKTKAEKSVVDAAAALKLATEELEATSADEKKNREDFKSGHGDLLKRMDAQKAVKQKLEADKPEIVRQHGLGLLAPMF